MNAILYTTAFFASIYAAGYNVVVMVVTMLPKEVNVVVTCCV